MWCAYKNSPPALGRDYNPRTGEWSPACGLGRRWNGLFITGHAQLAAHFHTRWWASAYFRECKDLGPRRRRAGGIKPIAQSVATWRRPILLRRLWGIYCTVAAMAHHHDNFFLFFFSFTLFHEWFSSVIYIYIYISPSLLLWCYQATQITHVLGGRMKELAEKADWEKLLKDVANAMA